MRLAPSSLARIRRSLTDTAGLWRVVRKELTWRRVLIAEVLGLSLNVLRYFDGWGPTHHIVARTCFTTLAPLLLVVAALTAAEVVRRGTPPLRAYAVALLAAACISAGLQLVLRQVLGIHPLGGISSIALQEWGWIVSDLETVLLLGSFGFLAFYNRHSVERILQNVRAVELKRVRLENELIESRLATAQAQVDPRTLFESLARIRNLYASASPEADQALEELIQTLRTRRVATGAAAPSGGHGS